MPDSLSCHCQLPNLSKLEAADDGGKSSSSSNTSSTEKGKKISYNAGRHTRQEIPLWRAYKFRTAQKVLAQVYDYGQEQKHHFFIITTVRHS